MACGTRFRVMKVQSSTFRHGVAYTDQTFSHIFPDCKETNRFTFIENNYIIERDIRNILTF